ncbi:MAG TPA: acyltransferase, partial [Burkholderiales bacterium]|nr:acyltransferase [Burkholderiales bacterium]
MKRQNNFDLIRFLMSWIVVLNHALVLSQSFNPAFFAHLSWVSYVVQVFFVVSGYLVFGSYETSRSLPQYYAKRVRRIYPAYVFAIVFWAVVGVLLSTLPPVEYFLSRQLYSYLGFNLVFLNFISPTLPGVFSSNPWVEVNGALWTLKVEVLFYALVPVFVWLFRQFGLVRILVLFYVLSVLYMVGVRELAATTGQLAYLRLQFQFPGQLTYFLAGGLLYYREAALRRWLLPGALLAIPILAFPIPVLDAIIGPMALAFLTVWFATQFRYLGNFGRYGDFSFGVYTFHFPTLQWMISEGWFATNPVGALIGACALVMVSAFFSWHVVEKPFLLRSSHYVKA